MESKTLRYMGEIQRSTKKVSTSWIAYLVVSVDILQWIESSNRTNDGAIVRGTLNIKMPKPAQELFEEIVMNSY